MDSNTIYEYYSRVSDRYYLARTFMENGKTRLRYLWQPMAHKVTITGFEDFDLFIYAERKCLMLCEGLTGAVIVNQHLLTSRIMRRCKQKMFVSCLQAELGRLGGRGNLNQIIVNWLVDREQEISPRYKPIKV